MTYRRAVESEILDHVQGLLLMFPILTTPLALIGLATLPALIAIYILRNRSRIQPVSSLLLWVSPRINPDGGTRIEKFRPSMLFWLEFLALLLLVLAAAAPFVPTSSGVRPLIVVLDDSYSMLAGAPDSPRKRAAEALLDELRQRPRGSVRLILAGDRAQLLGDGAQRASEVEAMLENWTCEAPTARIDLALALAYELGGELATIIVLSDHGPAQTSTSDQSRVRWWAFGTPRPNWAFVNASRSAGPRGDRLLLEIANLADQARSTTLRIEASSPGSPKSPSRELQRSELHLDPRETHRLVLELPEGPNAPSIVRATIDDDDLPFDNSVTLVPTSSRLVRYDNRLAEGKLRSVVERAVRATGGATPADIRPQLVFLDGDTPAPDSEDAWVVRIVVESEADAFTGPFVLDRSHPLTEGLSLAGVVWGGGKSALSGAPVIMAGNIPLVTDLEQAGKHEIRLRMRQDLSTLTESPAWPALIWNLVRWRATHLPGFDRTNIRLGEEATWNLSSSEDRAELRGPSGDLSTVQAHGRRIAIRPDRPGVYSLRAGEQSAELAVNPLNRDESDLTKCSTGRWGDERDETTLQLEYRDLMWLPVLLALAIATLHLWLVSRVGTQPRRGDGL